jgi:hypothetical protein
MLRYYGCARCDPYMPTYILPIPKLPVPVCGHFIRDGRVSLLLFIVAERCRTKRTSYSTLGWQARFTHENARHTT